MGLGLKRVIWAEDRDLVMINIELTFDTVRMDKLPSFLPREKRSSERSEEYQYYRSVWEKGDLEDTVS